FERTQRLIVASKLTLTLEDLNEHRRLVIFSRGENLTALGRNSGVALNELGEHATLGFNTQAQRRDVDEQNVLTLTTDNTSLQGSTDGNNLVGVNTLIGVLTGQFLYDFGDSRHTSGTTDQNHVVN